jgi:hypothetical protein
MKKITSHKYMKKNKRYTKKYHKYKKNKRYTKKYHKYMKKKIFGGSLDKYLILYNKYINLDATQPPLLNKEYTKKICFIPLSELMVLSSNIIENIIKSSTYSLLPYYFLEDLVTLEQQDLIVSKQNSGNCVSFAYMVIENLKTYSIEEAIIIPATLPPRLVQYGYPKYGHVAVVLETDSNFIIFEPAYFILTPIVIKKSGEPIIIDVVVFNTKWTFFYDETTQRINVTMDEDPLYFYEICIIENPSLAVSYPINIMNKRIPIVKFDYDTNKKMAHLSIRIDIQKLEGYNVNYSSSSDHWYERFDWKTCLDNEFSSEEQIDILSQWDGFSQVQCINLNVDKIELVKKVYSIIKTEWDKIQKTKVLGGCVKKYENNENYWW